MAYNKNFKKIIKYLNQEGVEFLIVGAYAVIFYTEPRYTKDLDLWLRPKHENAEAVLKALKKFGVNVKNISAEELCDPGFILHIGKEPDQIDFLMSIEGLTFERAWKNKIRSHYESEKIHLLELKDLIKAKKASGRLQDLIDLKKLQYVARHRKRDQGA